MNSAQLAEQERHEWLATVEHALTLDPYAISLLYEHATTLDALGEDLRAEAAYCRLLEQDPSNFSGLERFGHLLIRQGRLADAVSVHAELLKQYPNDATALALFAHLLMLGGHLHAAQEYYNYALSLAPHHTLVHRGLMTMYQQRGLHEQANYHARAASEDRAFFPRQYRGRGEPIHALLCISEAEGRKSEHMDRLIDDSNFLVTTWIVDRTPENIVLPQHDLVINGIGDADSAQAELQQLCAILTEHTTPVINPPHQMLQTKRLDIARRLAEIPGIRTPHMLELSPELTRSPNLLSHLTKHEIIFPFLLRLPSYHAGRFFYKIDDAATLAEALKNFPDLPLLAIEYIDTRGTQEYFHKYRMLSIDHQLYPVHLAFSRDWKIHYFNSEMARNAQLRDQEAAFLAEPRAKLGEQTWQALERIVSTIDLDYFGIDFALNEAGDLIVFEANAAMAISRPGKAAFWLYRHSAYQALRKAAHGMFVHRTLRLLQVA